MIQKVGQFKTSHTCLASPLLSFPSSPSLSPDLSLFLFILFSYLYYSSIEADFSYLLRKYSKSAKNFLATMKTCMTKLVVLAALALALRACGACAIALQEFLSMQTNDALANNLFSNPKPKGGCRFAE